MGRPSRTSDDRRLMAQMGRRLRWVREALGVNQTDMARMVGVTQTAWSLYERGKRWPDQLVVSLTEHRPFARWGKDKLLSEHGQVFAAPGSPDLSGLPELEGPDNRSADVIALYNQAQPLFAGSGRRVQGVSLSERGSWTLRLRDGTEVVVGRSDPEDRLRRFAHLLPQIAAARQGGVLLRADLRYTNGFTLSWQETPAPAPSVAPKHRAATPTPTPLKATTQQAHT